MSLRLSVLDQSPVGEGSSREEALRSTVALATALDALGYTRFWLAEHHCSPGFAGVAPEILVAAILERTNRMRVGTGGVLLPLYSVEKVAEVFAVLAALHPGRVDAGLGRAGGPSAGYPDQLAALVRHLARAEPGEGPAAACPWLLGTSRSSAELAASLGTGYAFGQFLNPAPSVEALAYYRDSFAPTSAQPEPRAALAVRVVVADTDEAAAALADTILLWRARKDLGQDLPFPTIKTALHHTWTETELTRRRARSNNLIRGDPDSVRHDLATMAAGHHVNEIMVNTPLPSFEDRLRSYQLLADAFELNNKPA
ncbi:MAG: hypothetical protein QOC97_729 [Chloroflexota bacterium]|nr:hypothetical protein [Chloroflexota bacterium]